MRGSSCSMFLPESCRTIAGTQGRSVRTVAVVDCAWRPAPCRAGPAGRPEGGPRRLALGFLEIEKAYGTED